MNVEEEKKKKKEKTRLRDEILKIRECIRGRDYIASDNIGAIVRILPSGGYDVRDDVGEEEGRIYTTGCLSSRREKGACAYYLTIRARGGFFLNGRHSGAFTGHYFLRGRKRQKGETRPFAALSQ